MIWALIAILTLGALAALALPLRSVRGPSPTRDSYDLEIYRDQLAELERDEGRGLIGGAEARAARAEIARRALAAGESVGGEKKRAPAVATGFRPAALACAVAAPAAALALYLLIGSPTLPGQPLTDRLAGMRSDDDLVGRLAARLQANPEDAQGWVLLARSYTAMGRPRDAVAAWKQAVARAPSGATYASQYGEALVEAENGMVTPEALRQFDAARTADPADPRAWFYAGMAKAQGGESREAVQIWTDLVFMSPQDAPWLDMVRDQIRRTAGDARIDLAGVKPSPQALASAPAQAAAPPAAPIGPPVQLPGSAARGPTTEDMAAAANMSPEDRTAMIRGMVDQLASRLQGEPNDIDGWLRLARAREVLGDNDLAIAAYVRASALLPANSPRRAEIQAQLDRLTTRK